MLYENKIKKGRADIKINPSCTLAHIVLSNILKNQRYSVYFFTGTNGENGSKRGYIITDRFGNFNSTIRFSSNDYKMNDFKDISLILISNDLIDHSNDITGFRGPEYNYEEILFEKDSQNKNEYCKNEKYDELIDSLQDYWPFLTKIENVKTVKIDLKQFHSLNLNCIKNSMNQYMINSLKFYGFLIFGRCQRKDKYIYMIGIPDKYNPSQVIPMANMGSNRFNGIDLTKKPQMGDLGFWSVYI